MTEYLNPDHRGSESVSSMPFCTAFKCRTDLLPPLFGLFSPMTMNPSNVNILQWPFPFYQMLFWPIGLPRWCSAKESTCWYRRHKKCGFDPWVGKIPWSRKWQPTLVFLPRKFHGQRNLGATAHRVEKSQTGLSTRMHIHIHTHTHTHTFWPRV